MTPASWWSMSFSVSWRACSSFSLAFSISRASILARSSADSVGSTIVAAGGGVTAARGFTKSVGGMLVGVVALGLAKGSPY